MVILFNFGGGARGGAYFQFFRNISGNIDFRYRNMQYLKNLWIFLHFMELVLKSTKVVHCVLNEVVCSDINDAVLWDF